MDINEKALQLHYEMNGKIEVVSRKPVETREDLSLLYTPGVAEPCKVIAKDKEAATEALKVAIKIIDKANSKGVVAKNNCARNKSRITKKVNEME